VESGCLMAVSPAMGLRWEVTSTTSSACTRPSYSERWVLRSRTDTRLATTSDTPDPPFVTTLAASHQGLIGAGAHDHQETEVLRLLRMHICDSLRGT
jgi:hypothetical protein